VPFTTELWDVETAAGVEKVEFFMERGRTEEEYLQLIEWADENSEDGFIDWQPFDHPQLGEVEIGGWNNMFIFRNPPPKFIEDIARPNLQFTLHHAASSPLIRLQEPTVTSIAPGLFTVEAIVGNEGYLPTNLTDRALELDKIPVVSICLTSDEDIEFVVGEAKQELGHLAGYSERRHPWNAWGPDWSPTRAEATWQVRIPKGESREVRIVASSQKGGTVSRTVMLES
jgi:hypothetical protein